MYLLCQIITESAANILVLAGEAYDQHQLDLSRGALFQPGRRPTANPMNTALNAAQRPLPASLYFQSNELTSKIDALSKQVAALTTEIQKPTQQGSKTPSYALAASKHVPSATGSAPRPTQPAKKQPHRQATIRPTTTATLSQTNTSQPVLTDQTTPRILGALNGHLASKKIKPHKNSKMYVEVKSIQRHTFNDLTLHLESPSHAEALRKSAEKWLPTFSANLTLTPETNAILIHGITTTFNPQNPERLEDLIASNGDRLASLKSIRWMNAKAVEEKKKNYSSIILFLADREAAQRCVRDRFGTVSTRKVPKPGRTPPPPPRCYNCLRLGHTAAVCPQKALCPYCGDKNHAHTCAKKGTTPPECTLCAREKKKLDPQVNLKGIFAANPTDSLHSPFDPNCAVKQAKTPTNKSSHSVRIATRS